MKSYSAARMRELDRRSIEEHGIPGAALMENAGTALVRAILRFAAGFDAPEFVILAGKGNNGGDACVAARQLDLRGFPVRLFMTARPDELAGDAAEMFEALPQKLKNELRFEFSSGDLSEQSIVIDGLLGTGVRGDLREPFASWIRIVNESGVPVIAVDIPSGLNADDGTASLCMQADLTVTMAGVKTGMLLERGPLVSGRIEVARIGIPESELEEAADGLPVFTNLDARSLLRREPFDTFKNRRGHLAVIGGSARYASAPFLSAEAALRTGCGLVTLFLPESAEIHCIVRKALILRRVPDEGGPVFCASSLTEIESALQDKSAFAIGPGLMDRPETLPFLTRLIQMEKPLVLDADALNLIAREPGILASHGESVILTPHPGEMRRLQSAFGLDGEKSRIDQALEMADCTGCTVILKGCRSVIASPDGAYSLNLSGCPALATAGSGDTLTGICGSFLAQGFSAWDAARLGAYLHGLAGEILAPCGSRGVIADDLASAAARAIHRILPTA